MESNYFLKESYYVNENTKNSNRRKNTPNSNRRKNTPNSNRRKNTPNSNRRLILLCGVQGQPPRWGSGGEAPLEGGLRGSPPQKRKKKKKRGVEGVSPSLTPTILDSNS